MNYVVSDIHGKLHRLKTLEEHINLKQEDTLYILGDMIDRGEKSIEVIKHVMEHKNLVPLMGNHELMMLKALKYNDKEQMKHWNNNGNKKTKEDFRKLGEEEKQNILNFIDSLSYFKIVLNKFLLVHAGVNMKILSMFSGYLAFEKVLEGHKEELVWIREAFFNNKGPEKYTVIFGHTPRPYLDRRMGILPERPYKIWFDSIYKDKICIDTGNSCKGGRMGCLRLEDMREFYVE